MRIHNILFIIYLCSGILLLTQSYPLYRTFENVEELIDEARDFGNNDFYSDTNVKSSKRKSKSSSREKNFEKHNDFKEELSPPLDYYDELVNNDDRKYSFSSNNNFFSKFSMKMDSNSKETRKNIMVSIKASPGHENYYNHPRPAINKNKKKWYNQIYKFFKNTYKKTKSNVVNPTYSSLKTGYNSVKNGIDKVIRDEEEKEEKLEEIDEIQTPESDIFSDNSENDDIHEEEDDDDEKISYNIALGSSSSFPEYPLSKRDLNEKNENKNMSILYNNAAQQFESFYDYISGKVHQCISSFIETSKEKFEKLKGDFKSFISFFDNFKISATEAKNKFSKSISFFREAKKFPGRLKSMDTGETKTEKKGKETEEKKEINSKEMNELKEQIVQDNDDSQSQPAQPFFSFFRNAKVKKRDHRHFKIDEKTNDAFIEHEFNFTELQKNEIKLKENDSKKFPSLWFIPSSVFEYVVLKYFDFDFLFRSEVVSPSSKSTLFKRSYNNNDNFIKRHMKRKDFDFGAGELVKGTKEWSNYYSYVEKMRSEELDYFKNLKDLPLTSTKSKLTSPAVSDMIENKLSGESISLLNDTWVNNKGRDYEADFSEVNQSSKNLAKNKEGSKFSLGKKENEEETKSEENAKVFRFTETKNFEQEEKVYILDYNTLRNGFPQYSIKRQRDRFRSNLLLSSLENFDTDEIFNHLTSKEKHSITINKRYYWYTDRDLVDEMYSELVSTEEEDQEDESEISTSSRKKEFKKRELINRLKKRDSVFSINLNNHHKKVEMLNNKKSNTTDASKKDKMFRKINTDDDVNSNKLTGKIKINNKTTSRSNSTLPDDGEEEFSSDDEDENNIKDNDENDDEDEVENMLKIDFICSLEHFSEKVCNNTKNVVNRAGLRLSSVIDFPSTINIKVTFSSYCKEFNECKTTTLGSSSPSYFYEFTKDFDSKRKKNNNGTEPLYYTDNEFRIDTNFSYPGALAKQRGKLNNGFVYDISLWLNGDWDWYFGKDQEERDIQPRQYDLEQVVIHEYLHGFGFVSSWYNWITNNDQEILIPSWLSWNTKKGGYHGLNKPYIYNKYLADVRENKWLMDYQTAIINDFANYPVFDSYTKVVDHFYNTISYNYSQKIYEIFTTPESVVFWCKKPVNSAEPHWVVLYTNKKYKSGSTISHLDSNRYLKSSGFLMRPSGVRNVILDEYKYNIHNHNGIGDDILCILGTLGYRIKYDPSELIEETPVTNLTTNSTNIENKTKGFTKGNKGDGEDDSNTEDVENSEDIHENLGNIFKKKILDINKKLNDTYINNINRVKKLNIPINNNTTTTNNNINIQSINTTTSSFTSSITRNRFPFMNITTRKSMKTTSIVSEATTTTINEKKFKYKTINAIFKQKIQ